MSGRLAGWIVGAVFAGVLLSQTFFVVGQTQQAVVTYFGDPVRFINPPPQNDAGLKLKIPFLENVTILHRLNLAIEPPPAEVICADNKRLVVDAFVRYRIVDPRQFYRTLHNEEQADTLVQPLINSSLREVLGTANLIDIISSRRLEMMRLTLQDLRERVRRQNLGVEIIDVRLKHADLPAENQPAVFQRMTTNLQQQAAQRRALGAARKTEIIAEADKLVTITLAQANQQALTLSGDGEAQRAQILAASFGKDPSFAAFWRSMEAYRTALANGDTTMVLSPDSDFFKYFKQGPGSR